MIEPRFGFVQLTLVAYLSAGFASAASPSIPRPNVIKPTQTIVEPTRHRMDVIMVKFRDGLVVRLRGGALTDLGTGALDTASDILAAVATGRWQRSHSLAEQKLDELRQKAQQNLGRAIADLNLQFNLFLPEGSNPSATIDAFNSLDSVEIALPISLPAPPPVPPDFEPNQGYLDSATAGVDADCMWLVQCAAGNFVTVADIEYSWNLNHLDLPPITLLGPAPSDPFNNTNHGTAVLGQISALRNGFGVTGIAYESKMYVATTYAGVWNVGAAITTTLGSLTAGDVLIIEQQTYGPNYIPGTQFGLVPVEWDILVYNAILVAGGVGVVVVEAGGNGRQNLDDPVYSQGNNGHWPFLPGNDSGAIIVGAGAPPGGFDVDRSRMGFSNYGSTVDLQGWGAHVYTTGYGSAYNAEGPNLWYTSGFSGTSSASAIVAGACALLQSAYKTATGTILTPAQVKAHLQSTGSPQQNGTYPVSEHIGPRPDAAAAFAAAFPAIDGNGNGVPDPCEFPGACCDTITGACTDSLLQADCLGACPCDGDCNDDGTIDLVDITCVIGCLGMAPSGACALADVSGDGVIDQGDVDTVNCLFAGNPVAQCCAASSPIQWSQLLSCNDIMCDTEPEETVPTVSTWGLITLSLLLLVVGKIHFARRIAVTLR